MILMRRLLTVLLVAAVGLIAAEWATAGASIDFAAAPAVLDLTTKLTPYKTSNAIDDGSHWYMVSAANGSIRPVTRVLLTPPPPDAHLRLHAIPARPEILQVAASDSQVIVEEARAYGRHAFRVTIPPASTVTLAIRVKFADRVPLMSAWTEPAIVSHNRQMAVLLAAVASMIAGAMAITLGLAVMTGHPAPIWASVFLVLIFVLRLAGTGTLDSGWATLIGGPFGLEVALAAFSAAAGVKLGETIVPISAERKNWADRGALALVIVGFAAFLGVPAAMPLADVLALVVPIGLTAYFFRKGFDGSQAARVAVPAAGVFSLASLAVAGTTLGVLSPDAAPALLGGFLAAGSVLLALAIAAGEGIAVAPASRYGAPRGDTMVARTPTMPDPTLRAAVQALEASHQGVFDLDLTTEKLALSGEAAVLLGLPRVPQSLSHGDWLARIHPQDRDVYRRAVEDYRRHAGAAFRIEFRIRSESGRYPWFELRATMGEGEHCLGLIADVSVRKEAEAVVTEQSLLDALTGLGSRTALEDILQSRDLSALTLAVLDIDRFKTVHASLGDAGADGVLEMFAGRLKDLLGEGVPLFRVGGDSFATLLAQSTDSDALGDALLSVVREPFLRDGRSVFLTVSIGIASGHAQMRDPAELLRRAELALVEAKRDGGDRATVYAPSFESRSLQDPVRLETELRRAIESGEIDVHYQPIMDLRNGRLAGFEALLRWSHPERGMIGPADFIAHCERTGLIVSVGRLALERAVRDLAHWQREFPGSPPLFMGVNVSRRQLLDDSFSTAIAKVVERYAPLSGTLKFEITESAISSATDCRELIARIKQSGASLAIDDFGTGVSNFRELRDLPFDTVKIDRAFLEHPENEQKGRDRRAVLGSIVDFVHKLGRVVVVEGVATADDAHLLRSLGCDFGQGYYFCAAMPREAVADFILRARERVPQA